MKKVSIIVPVYNVEKYIRRCLDSLVNQTIDDYEVIVVNDGSPDNSKDIILEYKEKYPEIIKLYDKENGGQGSARNLGIKKATGEYLGFVDSDDFVDVEMFKKMYDLAKEKDYDIVTCNYKIYYEESSNCEDYNLKINKETIFEDYIKTQPAIWNKLIKRKIIVDNELYFPEGIIYEDYALTPLTALYASSIAHLEENLYYYVVRGNSTMTQNKFNKKFHNIIPATDFLFKKVNEVGMKYYSEYEYIIICNLLRDNYMRLNKLKEAKYILDESTEWMKIHIPKWYKNKYYKKNFNFKEKIYNYLIYKKKYKMLGFGKND